MIVYNTKSLEGVGVGVFVGVTVIVGVTDGVGGVISLENTVLIIFYIIPVIIPMSMSPCNLGHL